MNTTLSINACDTVVRRLRLVTNEERDPSVKLMTATRKDVEFLAFVAEQFAYTLMTVQQREELLDWLNDIRQRYGL